MAKNQKPENELLTVRDFIRYGVSSFNKAGLFFGHGTDNPYDEAVYLVLETLNLPIDQLDPYMDARLTSPERKAVADIIVKRVKTRKPASYLTNRAYIQGLPFYVDERVIVPRSFIAEILCNDFNLIDPPDSVLDLCTGSGCLAVLAAHLYPQAEVDAVDLSADALKVAERNVEEHGVDVGLYKGDLFKPLKGKKYDLIITNPPYVDAQAMAMLPDEYKHEPKMALGSGFDGMDITRRILAEAADHLNDGGAIICEIGQGRDIIEAEYPGIEFTWLDTEASTGEVFFLTKEQLAR